MEETGLGTFDAAGRLDRLTGITTDVTDRETAEAEVAYLASFPKLNPNPIVEADPDGQVRFCNPALRHSCSRISRSAGRTTHG